MQASLAGTCRVGRVFQSACAGWRVPLNREAKRPTAPQPPDPLINGRKAAARNYCRHSRPTAYGRPLCTDLLLASYALNGVDAKMLRKKVFFRISHTRRTPPLKPHSHTPRTTGTYAARPRGSSSHPPPRPLAARPFRTAQPPPRLPAPLKQPLSPIRGTRRNWLTGPGPPLRYGPATQPRKWPRKSRRPCSITILKM